MPENAVMQMFTPAPEPPTELGRLRILSSTAGARVSPLQLGAMSVGEAWKENMGHMDKKTSFELLDAFFEAGGNFIDTANNYQNEESEIWLGEWMKERNNRDQIFMATKFTSGYATYRTGKGTPAANYSGNHKKSLHASVRDSLKKLQTDFIDLLYLHWWDWTTSIEEVMDSLHILVQQGKVLYLGISDTPAWIVAAANTYAKSHGKTPFSVYQGRWNVADRDLERDVVPMCRHFGMAIAPWNAIGGGKFQSKKAIEERKKNNEGLRNIFGGEQSENDIKISAALEEVGKEHGVESVTAVALAWIMAKAPNVFPIVGGRKVSHLKDNIQALKIKLTDEQIAKLESVVPYDPGFPTNMVGEDSAVTGQPSGLVGAVAPMAMLHGRKPIGHA